jgi:adenosine deaminase
VIADVADFARRIPKAELHVHLEGTIVPQAYRRIADRNGVEAGDVSQLFSCDDFPTFLRAFLEMVRVLQKPQDFAELATDYLQRAAADNVRHVEFFLSPATQRKFVPQLALAEMIRAVGDACNQAKQLHGVSSLLILDMVRNLGESAAMEDIELAMRCGDSGVIGVGLGGDERNFPARDFQRAYARARELGLRRTVHAGEAAGPQSIVDAVTLLGAERIGHGVAARGQSEVLALLRDRDVTIDACPTSNRITGALAPGEEHPLREFMEANVRVTLNSDDPAFFKTSVADEYANAAALGCGAHEIATIATNSVQASFLPDADKRRLLAEIDAFYDVDGITR